MKILIIDGPDNCGKNTIIKDIIDNHDSVKIIHCHKPDKSAADPLKEMEKVYFQHAASIIRDHSLKDTDIVVFNRYYIGEWVYGQMYRNEDPNAIKALIVSLEQHLLKHIGYDDIYYVQLLSTSPKLLKNNDDGKSLSNADMNKIWTENSMFKQAYGFSSLKKRMIYVNDREAFRPKDEIISEVRNFYS